MTTIELEPNLTALRDSDPDGLFIEALATFDYMMTVQDVAQFLGQTNQAITQYLREGSLRGIKCGKYWRIPKKLFVEYLYENVNK